MNKIDVQLEIIRKEKRIGLMTHVIVGYPTLSDTEEMVKTMNQEGVDFVELQIPFSDPLADGPTIMKACEKSLENGTRVENAFRVAAKLTKKVSIPLLFMAYYNTVFKYGVEKFCKKAKKSGISGLIVPDMPLEEEIHEHFSKYANKSSLQIIRVLSPASTVERIKKNTRIAKGFIYCTARQGITGNYTALDPKVVSYLRQVKKYTPVPIALGFGINTKEDISLASKYADIVVIGSAVVRIAEKFTGTELQLHVSKFLREHRI